MTGYAIIPFIIVFLVAPIASASYSPVTRAIDDRIGYRSNLIDPFNPYDTNRKRMFWSLLERYGLVPGYTEANRYTQNLDSSDYIARVQNLLSSENKALEVAKYHYAYGICKTNDYPSALAFMEMAAQELGSTPDTDRLIVARHYMLKLCNIEESDLPSFFDEFNTILLPLREKKRYSSWTAYLYGAIYFYEGRFEKAEATFSSIGEDSSGWIKDTADYMGVRISKAIAASFRVPPYQSPTVAPERKRALSNLQQAMRQYLNSHPKGRYVETVQNLGRYVFWMSGNRNALVTATHRDFTRIIASRTSVASKQKISFLDEVTDLTGAIFDIPKEAGNGFSTHPLAVVSELLAEVTNDRPLQEKSPSHVWRSRFIKGNEASASFSGLSDYFDLLLLAHDKKFNDIARQKISRKAFGPLYADALILQARALEKIGSQLDAANLWLNISKEYPLYNALTEAATAYVRAGRFVDFVRIKKTWMTDFALAKTAKDEWQDDEFNIGVKSFYAIYQPYRNLLRAGFETMVSREEAMSVYSDASLNPIIRFLAAEPILRTNLLKGNYSAFIGTAKHVFDAEFDAEWSKSDGGRETDLVVTYRRLIPKAEALVRNPDDPDALTAVGYFLYSKYRFPKCFGEITLWELSLKKCEGEQLKKYPVDQASPIDLLSKALSIYKLQPKRTSGEAKVLRILIFCFKGNERSCVRGSEDAYPKSVRKGYFQRLHKYFPKMAKQTPYWY